VRHPGAMPAYTAIRRNELTLRLPFEVDLFVQRKRTSLSVIVTACAQMWCGRFELHPQLCIRWGSLGVRGIDAAVVATRFGNFILLDSHVWLPLPSGSFIGSLPKTTVFSDQLRLGRERRLGRAYADVTNLNWEICVLYNMGETCARAATLIHCPAKPSRVSIRR